MSVRLGDQADLTCQPLARGQTLNVNGIGLRLEPAGDILGSAQVVLECAGARAVVSGDDKRTADPTCAPFELILCDHFATEATFGPPVFRHGDPINEVARLLASLQLPLPPASIASVGQVG